MPAGTPPRGRLNTLRSGGADGSSVSSLRSHGSKDVLLDMETMKLEVVPKEQKEAAMSEGRCPIALHCTLPSLLSTHPRHRGGYRWCRRLESLGAGARLCGYIGEAGIQDAIAAQRRIHASVAPPTAAGALGLPAPEILTALSTSASSRAGGRSRGVGMSSVGCAAHHTCGCIARRHLSLSRMDSRICLAVWTLLPSGPALWQADGPHSISGHSRRRCLSPQHTSQHLACSKVNCARSAPPCGVQRYGGRRHDYASR